MGWAPILPLVRRHRRRRLLARRPHAARAPEPSPSRPASLVLINSGTRTFWSRGAEVPLTLVESDLSSPSRPLRDRVRALVTAHERGIGRTGARPRGNPAFSEALFVELVRGGQHARAFELLAPECQRSWGSPERFAAAHGGTSLPRLEGVQVVAVRNLEEWVDPDRGARHRQVAELDVEYSFGGGQRVVRLPRTVHLVAVEGRWRSLSYPVAEALAS